MQHWPAILLPILGPIDKRDVEEFSIYFPTPGNIFGDAKARTSIQKGSTALFPHIFTEIGEAQLCDKKYFVQGTGARLAQNDEISLAIRGLCNAEPGSLEGSMRKVNVSSSLYHIIRSNS